VVLSFNPDTGGVRARYGLGQRPRQLGSGACSFLAGS
jgi:hypothetical protein